jgi:hypothetical protein
MEQNPLYTQDFNDFWKLYPNKSAKLAAAKAWKKAAVSLQVVKDALAWQTQQQGWTKERGAFVPHASTWLNGRRWEDENPNPSRRVSPEAVKMAEERQARLRSEAVKRLEQETAREKMLVVAWRTWSEGKKQAVLDAIAQEGPILARKVQECRAKGGHFEPADAICTAILLLDQTKGLPG